VLWLTVVVAVVVTWQIDRRAAAKRYNDLNAVSKPDLLQ
jgi:hypothetical protein